MRYLLRIFTVSKSLLALNCSELSNFDSLNLVMLTTIVARGKEAIVS